MDWATVGKNGLFAIDKTRSHGGTQSLRIDRPTKEFTGVGQGVDATAWRGKLVVLRGWFQTDNIGTGPAGLWFRGDEKKRQNFFVNSYAQPLTDSTGWVKREVFARIPEGTERLVFGVALSASGTLWADDFELVELDVHAPPILSPEAKSYLDRAIALIQSNALNAPRVPWEELNASLYAIAAKANAPADTYPAISFALNALDDHHSHFVAPARAREVAENLRTDDFDQQSRSIGDKAYIRVPAYVGNAPSRMTAFVDEMQGRIAELEKSSPCGWIVDLRGDGGGNMYPMVAGLSPILGNGTLGYLVGPSSRSPWWTLDGAAGSRDTIDVRPSHVRSTKRAVRMPVAVLTGPQTGSSGEAVAISFIGRPETRSFGKPTSGYSTANQSIPLSDGAQLVLTRAVMADRNGRQYGGPIAPDEPTTNPPVSSADDATLADADRWLSSQPACRH